MRKFFARIGLGLVMIFLWGGDASAAKVKKLTGFEVHEIISQILRGDYAQFNELPLRQQRQVFSTIARERIYPDDSQKLGFVFDTMAVLPICSPGYWGANQAGEVIEHNGQTLGLKYQVGPNCYRWDDTGDCGGTDDIRLSFYFGNHAESLAQLAPMLRWATNSIAATLYLMVVHGGKISSRVYEQTEGGGRDNYNVYACIPGYLYPYINTFVIRKY